ncbi:hypothetical protein [Gloeothece verrucosa]|uniref:Uncharacterized protein n=1 Tax=Gloeothece verrucosa (strain PCC 7822) TaxID=497965 RepID=E0U6U5_GLOV7|nr:hypothetical protein [Gloeothece verrucosa]ADN15982.1 conserved hypothetical protein [Gloeothece verrucosa PCC 7822]
MVNKSININTNWWNKPLWGDDNLFQSLKKPKIEKLAIPFEVVSHYQEIYQILIFIASVTQSIDSCKFLDPEFQLFCQIKWQFISECGNYKGLNHSLILLRAALEAKDKFLTLEETELRYRSKAQQEFYQEVYSLLSKQTEPHDFLVIVQDKLNQIRFDLKTEEGKTALESYVKILEILAEQNAIGLKLFYLFKKYFFAEFSSVKLLSELLSYLVPQNVQDINAITLIVQKHYDSIAPLGKILELPPEKNQIESYVIMLQYLVLRDKHQETYLLFTKLIELLIEWNNTHQELKRIHQEYSPNEYDIPATFNKNYPGESLYQKYQQFIVYFANQKLARETI